MFPIGDDNPTRTTPFVNYGLIVANVLVFAFVNLSERPAQVQQVFEQWGYDNSRQASLQILSYQFLHAGWFHILNNLWMLWIVGDNVEDKLGHVRYLLLYLAGGVVAAWTYTVASGFFGPIEAAGGAVVPLVGASGSIFAIMGMYLVFFPEARIRILLWFLLLVQVIRVRAKWVIGIWLGLEIWRTLEAGGTAAGEVATSAHVGGGLFGIGVAFLLKKSLGGGGDGDAWDVHTGFSRHSRSATSSRHEVYGADAGWFEAPEPPEDSLVGLEDQIVQLVEGGRMDEALELYPGYESMYRERPLPGAVQIEIAHEFYERGLPRDALDAYLRYIETEPRGEHRAEAHFRAGVLLQQWFAQNAAARPHLEIATREHRDPAIRRFAQDALARL